MVINLLSCTENRLIFWLLTAKSYRTPHLYIFSRFVLGPKCNKKSQRIEQYLFVLANQPNQIRERVTTEVLHCANRI